jgi:hypothetical protein
MLAQIGFPSLLEEISGNPSGWQDKKAGSNSFSQDW